MSQICVGELQTGFGVCETVTVGSLCFVGGEPCSNVNGQLVCVASTQGSDFGTCEKISSTFFAGAKCDLDNTDPSAINCGSGAGNNPELVCVGFDGTGVCVDKDDLQGIIIQGTTCNQGVTSCTKDSQCGPCGACLNQFTLACTSSDSQCFCSCDLAAGGASVLGTMCSASTSSTWLSSSMPSNMKPVQPQEQCGFCVQVSAFGAPLQTACVASVNLFDMDDICFRDEGRSEWTKKMFDTDGKHSNDFDFCRAEFCHPRSGLCVGAVKGQRCPFSSSNVGVEAQGGGNNNNNDNNHNNDNNNDNNNNNHNNGQEECCVGICVDDDKRKGKLMCQFPECEVVKDNKKCPENNCYPDRKWNSNTNKCDMGKKMDCSKFWSADALSAMGMHEECSDFECDESRGYQCMPSSSQHDGKSCSSDGSKIGQTCRNGQCQGGNHRCDESNGWNWQPNGGHNQQGACMRKKGPGGNGPSGPGGPQGPGQGHPGDDNHNNNNNNNNNGKRRRKNNNKNNNNDNNNYNNNNGNNNYNNRNGIEAVGPNPSPPDLSSSSSG